MLLSSPQCQSLVPTLLSCGGFRRKKRRQKLFGSVVSPGQTQGWLCRSIKPTPQLSDGSLWAGFGRAGPRRSLHPHCDTIALLGPPGLREGCGDAHASLYSLLQPPFMGQSASWDRGEARTSEKWKLHPGLCRLLMRLVLTGAPQLLSQLWRVLGTDL